MKLAETEKHHEEAKLTLSNAIRKIEQFENEINECETKLSGRPIVKDLQQEILELKAQLQAKNEELKNEVSISQEASSQMKVCQGKVISLSNEMNEALQTHATTEKLLASITQSKDTEVEKLASKLEEMQKKEVRQQELLKRNQDEQKKVERKVVELQDLLRSLQANAKKHYCNATMLREDIVTYTLSTTKALGRKVNPFVLTVKKNVKKAYATARVKLLRFYKLHFIPNWKIMDASARDFYRSRAQVHVDKYLQPLYDRHLASHVSLTLRLIDEIRTSVYLLAIACVKDTSSALLNAIGTQPKPGKEDVAKYPNWFLDALRFASKDAENVVDASSNVLKWLFMVWLGRIFLRFLLNVICLPFRGIGLIFRKKKKVFTKPHITKV